MYRNMAITALIAIGLVVAGCGGGGGGDGEMASRMFIRSMVRILRWRKAVRQRYPYIWPSRRQHQQAIR